MHIFVQIAAYRDRELPWTINDAITKADHPNSLSFGVCWQGNPEDNQWVDGFRFVPDCRIVKVLASESGGCCWARKQTQSLWRGEEYSLQVDSHSRFAQGWDTKLLAMLDDCNSSKPVLTAYPASYIFPDQVDINAVPFRIGANQFSSYGVLELQATNPINSDVPVPGYFLSAGMVFGSSEWIKEIPYDDQLYFNGEESSLAMRFFVQGWDIFHPNQVVVYHNYNRHNSPRHQNEYTNTEKELASYKRYKDVMTNEAGNVRSLAEYERLSGVNFRKKTITKKSKIGVFVNA